jgi:hypothetical protein
MPIYRKGEEQMGLQKSALTQSINEASATRKMSDEQKYKRDVASGAQGAKNIVNYNPTVKEATDSPTSFGGPVSGSALIKLKAKKIEAKRTAEREMKRR